MTEKPLRCRALIFKRDTYRRTGRGRGGFEMHYRRQQCARRAKVGDLCAQHAKWPAIPRCEWAEERVR